MNLVEQSFLPVKTLGSLGAEPANRGCPPAGQCGECVPFCCFAGQEISSFVSKTSFGEYAYDVIVNAVMLAVNAIPGYGTILSAAIAVEEYLLKPVVNWLNHEINKQKLIEQQQQIQESSARSMQYQLGTMLQCRLDWCRCLSNLQNLPVFASNSPTFGSSGPEVGAKFMAIYLAAANKLNNERFGKTAQKILAVQSYPWELEESNFIKGRLLIQVPNIEHYWQGDHITVPGFIPAEQKVIARHRSGTSKEITWDCDRFFVDIEIYPNRILEKGRGCKIGISAGYNGSARSLGGKRDGANIRNLQGVGWIWTNIPYQPSHENLVGKIVNLANPVYITESGQAVVPNAGEYEDIEKMNLGIPKAGEKLNQLMTRVAGFANAENMGNLLLFGVGGWLLYAAISGKTQKYYEENYRDKQ